MKHLKLVRIGIISVSLGFLLSSQCPFAAAEAQDGFVCVPFAIAAKSAAAWTPVSHSPGNAGTSTADTRISELRSREYFVCKWDAGAGECRWRARSVRFYLCLARLREGSSSRSARYLDESGASSRARRDLARAARRRPWRSLFITMRPRCRLWTGPTMGCDLATATHILARHTCCSELRAACTRSGSSRTMRKFAKPAFWRSKLWAIRFLSTKY